MKQKRLLFLARAAMTLLLVMLCSLGTWAEQTPVSLTSDGNGGWYINMPAKGTATSVANAAVLTLTADDISAGKVPFKVYDDGGKDGNYSQNYTSFLLITVPDNYVIKMTGTAYTESTSWDYLKIYDGTNTSATNLGGIIGGKVSSPNVNVESSGNNLLVYFYSDGSNEYSGLDLTAEIVDSYDLSKATATIPSYLPYTGAPIAVTPIVTALNKVVLTKDTHYSVTTVPATVQELGDYEVTITGLAPYYGTINGNLTVTAGFAGEGTVESPYLISTKSEYLLFASLINASVAPYAESGKVYQLTANIGSELDPITTKIGEDGGAHFTGVFDGAGHTLYVNINDTEHSGTATFGYIEGATIKNLTVAGSVTGGIHAAALVGFSTGTNNLIQNCTVSASVNGGTHIGGILGHGLSSDIAIENCIYSGLMTGGNSAKGAIFGWGDNGGTKSVTNCVYLKHGSQNTSNLDLVKKNGGDVTVTNSYKTANNGSYGIYATAEAPASGLSKPITVLGVNLWVPVSVSGIESYYIYNGSVIPVLPTVTCAGNTLTLNTDYTIASTPAPIQATGNYTLTVTGINDYTGTDSKNFEVIQTFANGDGSEANPYLIENADDWNLFAQYMTEGRSTFLSKFYKLTSDITVTTMAGNSPSNCFKGVFDGDSHTMTLNLTATTENCAPFKYLSSATIKNLNIAGTVTTSSKLGASIAAHTYNTTNIQNCTSSVIITSTFESLADGTHAGFVAVNEGSATLNISNCVFTGKLLGANAYANGGFVGWANSTVNYTDCLFAPTEITMNELNSATFNRNGKNTFTNTYFLTQFGEAQGIHLATAAPASDVYKSEMVTVRETNYYAVCDITGVNDTYYHTGSAIAVTPVVKLGSTTLTANTDYTVVIKNSSDETVAPEELIANGSYTLIITGMGDYTGSCTMAFRITSGEALNGYTYETGTDAEGTYYMIQSVEDFNQFALFVVSSDNASVGKRFKQTADLTVTTMVGSNENKSFQGVYDGDNHTLTLGITASSNIAAPFRYVKGATIKNLTIAGALSNSGKQNGGVAGYSYGDVAISNCTVSASITTSYSGDASNGGFIAHVQSGNVNISNSVFCGRLLGASSSHSGGFVGWRNNTSNVLTFDNCLFAPAEVTMSANNSATFNRNETTNNTYSKCYYLTPFGEEQGARVTTDAPATGVYKSVVAADANNYFAHCDITNARPLYAYTGSAIAVTPVVKLCDETLTQGTDYTVTFKNSSDVVVAAENLIELGSYTATIAGTGSCAGSKTFSFRIINGEDLDGYVFETGTDETGKYYSIANEGELEYFAEYVNSGHDATGLRFKQTANITLTEEHTAIGNNNHRFKGVYDGDNKTISGLVINKPDAQYQGLFGYTDGYSTSAAVKNVNIVNCNITGGSYTAGVIGYAYYTPISNCTVSGTIQKGAEKTANDIGGIAGYANDSKITGCSNSATVEGSSYVGGIAGYFSWHTCSDNFNTGVVTGTSYVGSIIGYLGSAVTLRNNYYPAGLGLNGGVGASNKATGTDQGGAEIVFTVTAGANTQVTLPETPTKVYNEANYYKNGTEVTLNYNVPDGKFFDQYTVTSGALSKPFNIDGKHILSAVADNITITGSHTDKMSLSSEAVSINIGTIPYTGSVIAVAPVVKRLDVTLVQGTDYTITTDPATVQAIGDYTLTITGQGDYTGTKQATFSVKEATLIHNAEDWATVATNINAGTGCDGYYKLADDFDNTTAVTATIGTQEHPFTGLFDGNGKTLNVNISETSTQGTAPFREIAGATIKNLTVSGSVTGTTHAAGLVGFTRSGINNIENCVVNTNVTANTGSNRHIGGVVGHGIQATLNITNTVFTGTLSNNTYAGGLLGWSDGSTLNITNCLVTGSKNGDRFHPIAIKNNTAVMDGTVDGAFYTVNPTLTDANYIAATGIKVYTGVQEAFCKKEYTFSETDYYSKETTEIGNVANTTEYTGDVIAIEPTVSYNGTALTPTTDFTFATEPATVQEKGEYTLTITGQGNYAGTQTLKFYVVAGVLSGEGTENSPYIIASAEDWGKFAGNINTGSYNYSGQFVQMTQNITVSTMAGNSEANSFQGTFLGTAGKTMTLDLTGTADNCAPFGYLKNATIKDLTIAGTITTGYKFGASIATHNYGTTHIQNCVSTVVITSTFEESKDGTHAGFVAVNEGSAYLYFNDCVFAGKLLGANATSNGGFLGWNSGSQAYYTDCLFAPAEITMSTNSSYTFNRNARCSTTRAYYLTKFGDAQGKQAFAAEDVPAEGLFGQITAADGNTYYVQGSIGNINDSYAYTGAVININPTFSISNESVNFVKDTDFEVAITKGGNPVAEVLEFGDYVFTISGKDGGKCKGSFTKNVNVYGAVPTNFKWSEVTVSTATLVWDDNTGTNWTVELSESSDFSTLVESKDVTAKTVTFDGLTAETDYYARVQAVYGEVRSNWSATCSVQPSTKLMVGSGTNTSSSVPFHNWYYYNLSQQIYTPAELGNKAGSILSVDFYRTDYNTCYNTIDVYLVNTSKSSFENNTDWMTVTDADKVFSGRVDFPSNAWGTITLDTPFDYDGTSNLAVVVYHHKNGQDTYGSGRNFRVFEGAGNQALWYNNDSTDPTINPTTNGSIGNWKNQLRIRLADKITMNEHGIMTYASANVLDFSNVADLEATYASNFATNGDNTGVLTMTPATKVAATEGLMLRGTANETYYVPVTTEAIAAFSPANLMVGLTEATLVNKKQTIAAEEYTTFILGKKNGHINWYVLAEDSYTLKANSAYLRLRSADVFNLSALGITMDFGNGDVTDIASVSAETENKGEGWYTLGGLKLDQKPTAKGVYIHNGAKVVIK